MVLTETDIKTTKRTPTSININEDLWYELRTQALREKTTATELLEEAVRDLLAKKAIAKEGKPGKK